MDCEGVKKFTEMWIDEELDASSKKEFSDHLGACGPCREKVEGETRLEHAIRERVPRERMPDDTWRRVTRRLEREARPGRRGVIAAIALAAAACAVFSFAWYGWWSAHKPDLETAAIALQRKWAQGGLAPQIRTTSADELEQFLAANLGMQVDLQCAMSGRCGAHAVKFEGAMVVKLGGVEAACLAYRCCGEPVTVFLLPKDKLESFPEMRKAIAALGQKDEIRLHDSYRATNIEVRGHGPWLACVVGDHPIEDLASVFERI